MHASRELPLLKRWLRRACPAIHTARSAVILAVVDSLVRGGKLTLTHLGATYRAELSRSTPSSASIVSSAIGISTKNDRASIGQ